jgi:lipopolysaccharide/colanic/teichoic acid biosynthesis glycosyltransferase
MSLPRHGPVSSIERVQDIPVTREMPSQSAQESDGISPRVRRSETLDRVMNIAISAFGLVLATPIMLLFAALIKLTSPGPIFYSQTRVGLNRRRPSSGQRPYDRRTRNLGGRPFMIYKLRTMRMDAEKPNGAVWATQGDPRVTPVGLIMRKYRIDELPQLFNVIRGDMNIVGPRPERPSIFSRLCDDIAEYPHRQRAKPGITGWAQINQSYDRNIDDVRSKVRFDLEYLQRQGVREDLKIMARTVPVMIFRKGGW